MNEYSLAKVKLIYIDHSYGPAVMRAHCFLLYFYLTTTFLAFPSFVRMILRPFCGWFILLP